MIRNYRGTDSFLKLDLGFQFLSESTFRMLFVNCSSSNPSFWRTLLARSSILNFGIARLLDVRTDVDVRGV